MTKRQAWKVMRAAHEGRHRRGTVARARVVSGAFSVSRLFTAMDFGYRDSVVVMCQAREPGGFVRTWWSMRRAPFPSVYGLSTGV